MSSLLQQAEQLVHQQEYAKALSAIQPVLLQEPDNDKALNIAAVVEALQGNSATAIDYFSQAIKANTGNTDAITNLCALINKNQENCVPHLQVLANALAQWVSPQLQPETSKLIQLTFEKLAFNKSETMEWLASVFEHYALKLLLTAIDNDHHDVAFFLEGTIYQHYVKREESEAHFERSFKRWKDQAHAAGQRYGKIANNVIAEANITPGQSTENGLPKIAFFLHTSSTLAHVEAVISFLSGHSQLKKPLISPKIITLASHDVNMVSQFQAINVPVMELDVEQQQLPRTGRYIFLKSHLLREGFETLVWVSSVPEMSFAFGLRLTKTQIWWTMKFHGFTLPSIDGYVSSMHVEEVFQQNGIQWHGGTLSSSSWLDETQTAEAKKLRNQFPHQCLYGTIAREEKLNDSRYLNCIADILEANPNAGYLFTGRELDPTIKHVLEERGVASRCHFVGWVYSKLYCQVIDIFLDSFPCGSGYSLLESMAAAKPVVMFNSPDFISYYPTVVDLINAYFPEDISTEPYHRSAARNVEEYKEVAVRLATCKEDYHQASQLNQLLIEELFANQQRCAQIYCKHFISISQQMSQSTAK